MIATIPPRHPPGKDNLAYWEDFLTDADITALLARPEWTTADHGVTGLSTNHSVNTKIRSSKVSWLQRDQETEHYWKIITNAVARVNAQFFQFDLSGCYEPIQLGVYQYSADDPGHYNWHADANNGDPLVVPRKLSMSLLLSDPSEFEGGELQVLVDNSEARSLEQQRGRAWFFPSWMLHRVTPVTKGIRRSLVLWVGGPPFR
jgi:PKHD-type hydroxylase